MRACVHKSECALVYVSVCVCKSISHKKKYLLKLFASLILMLASSVKFWISLRLYSKLFWLKTKFWISLRLYLILQYFSRWRLRVIFIWFTATTWNMLWCDTERTKKHFFNKVTTTETNSLGRRLATFFTKVTATQRILGNSPYGDKQFCMSLLKIARRSKALLIQCSRRH